MIRPLQLSLEFASIGRDNVDVGRAPKTQTAPTCRYPSLRGANWLSEGSRKLATYTAGALFGQPSVSQGSGPPTAVKPAEMGRNPDLNGPEGEICRPCCARTSDRSERCQDRSQSVDAFNRRQIGLFIGLKLVSFPIVGGTTPKHNTWLT